MKEGCDLRRAVSPFVVLAVSFCILGSQSARAQAVPSHAADRTDEKAQAPVADESLHEIIVTARRRPELLQRTPISIIALSAADLDSRSVTNLRGLQNFIPNLTFAPSQNVGEAAANVFIRGIGQEDFGVGAEGGVAFYVDGVYFARSLGLIMNLTDIDRIEVLRGPQGTLYGKDAIGGAINVISTMPAPRREHKASLIVGSYDRVELRSVANEPLSERLFMRLSIGLVSRDGYLRRLRPPASIVLVERANGKPIDLGAEGDDRALGARLQLRWLVTDTLTADLSVDGSRKRNRQGAIHIDLIDPRFDLFPVLNSLIREGKLPGPQITSNAAPRDLLQSYAGGNNFTDQDLWGASLVLTQQLGSNTLKFIGAYRGLRSHIGTDDDGLYFDIVGNDLSVRQRQLSGELQFTGGAGALAYTAGFFAFGENPRILPSAAINDVLYTCGCNDMPGDLPILSTDDRHLRSNSYAAYAQATYKFGPRLSATLGGRYTREEKKLEGKSYLVDANLGVTDAVLNEGAARDSWNFFTYRADLQYQATPELMTYASLARGFKSGGFNVRGDDGLPNMGFTSYGPESAITAEIGLRSEWLRRRVRFNATLFDSEYRDIQLRQQTVVDGMVTTLIENAAKARIKGAEVELTAVLLRRLTASAAYGFLDPKYLDVGTVRGLTLASDFQRTPHHSFAGSVDYEIPLPPGILKLHAEYTYRSKEQFQILAASNDQKAYGLLGARIAFRRASDRWTLALFGTNLADKRYRTAGRGTLIRQIGFAYSSIGMPRQFGLQVTTVF